MLKGGNRIYYAKNFSIKLSRFSCQFATVGWAYLLCSIICLEMSNLLKLCFTEINFSNFTFNTFSRTIFLQPLQKDVARVSSAAAPEAWPDPPSPVHVASIAPVSKELLYWACFFGEQPDSGNEHTPPRTAGALLR